MGTPWSWPVRTLGSPPRNPGAHGASLGRPVSSTWRHASSAAHSFELSMAQWPRARPTMEACSPPAIRPVRVAAVRNSAAACSHPRRRHRMRGTTPSLSPSPREIPRWPATPGPNNCLCRRRRFTRLSAGRTQRLVVEQPGALSGVALRHASVQVPGNRMNVSCRATARSEAVSLLFRATRRTFRAPLGRHENITVSTDENAYPRRDGPTNASCDVANTGSACLKFS
ncbi:hypothetical protein ATK30_6370 [Amycolatopsis echigonensis]|uniref:Uncharacterized protein n=1 Tax=Amycolatopsis echigonensis TaxID=2576905 RepID=A0A2N3WNK1_9PSEU|nr:hypothetical protein ATK30_6370 [Amycolatopsis niigatensis]